MQGIRFDNGFYALSKQDGPNGGVTYYGYAKPGTSSAAGGEEEAAWIIFRQTVNGTETKFEFAQGNRTEFKMKWSLRGTYEYSH